MSRSVFIVLYVLISAAGSLLAFMYLRVELPPASGLLFYFLADGPAEKFLALLYAAPVVLVALAYLRGRRIGMPSLALLPLAGILIVNAGPLLVRWVSQGESLAGAYPLLAALSLDVLCIWIGCRPDALPQTWSRRTA